MKATQTVHTIHRTLAALACALIVGCGGDDRQSPNVAAPTTLTPQQIRPPDLPSIDGYLISASTDGVVMLTAEGEQTLLVDEQDVPALGLEHMQSHAGINTLGFRVFYEQRGNRRFAKQAREIPPPALRPE